MIFDASVSGRTVRVEVRGGSGRYTLRLDGKPLEVGVSDAGSGSGYRSLLVGTTSHELGIEREGDAYRVSFPGVSVVVALAEAARGSATVAPRADGPARLTAPMPGRIVRVLSSAGADVEAGQGLMVIEAMKMENELRAPRGGRLTELLVREGQAVEAGALLAVVG
jgi:biotin carboxyl carrier protein